jgi:hypothetical protein
VVICGQLIAAGPGIGGTQFYLNPGAGSASGQAIIDSGSTGPSAQWVYRYRHANKMQTIQLADKWAVADISGGLGDGGNPLDYTPSTGLTRLGNGGQITLTFGGGAQIGSPTGGDPGAGGLNLAGALKDNGTAPLGVAGSGYMRANSPAVQLTKTSNYTVSANDTNTDFDNTGARGEVDFTLPAYAAGLRYCFMVTASQTVKVIAPASAKIAVGNSNSASAGNITANGVYASACLVATSVPNQWATKSTTGTWIVN